MALLFLYGRTRGTLLVFLAVSLAAAAASAETPYLTLHALGTNKVSVPTANARVESATASREVHVFERQQWFGADPAARSAVQSRPGRFPGAPARGPLRLEPGGRPPDHRGRPPAPPHPERPLSPVLQPRTPGGFLFRPHRRDGLRHAGLRQEREPDRLRRQAGPRRPSRRHPGSSRGS